MTASAGHEFQQRLQQIETLVGAVEAAADPAVRASAQSLVQLLLELHATGIERMLEITMDSSASGEALIDEFGRDELASSLMLLHGLHPLDLEARVAGALEKVQPNLGSHGGSVVLLGCNDGIVHLRLEGSCDGCPSSAATLRQLIEEAIYTAAPDVLGLNVEGLVEEPVRGTVAQNGFIPLANLLRDPGPLRPTVVLQR